MKGGATRHQIVSATDRPFYRLGYEHTSFTAIAETAQISRGTFYHRFKSKDLILDAVLDARLADTRRMPEQWESEHPEPGDRIRRFVGILLDNRADIQSYGCPVDTLTSELAKLDHTTLGQANGLFTLFRAWLLDQFALLGHAAEADELAMHLLTLSQGVATLANAFKDEDFVRREVRRTHDWLDTYTTT